MQTIANKVFEAVDALNVGQSLKKSELSIEIWGNDDYFTLRTLDVHYSKAKKALPNKIFKTKRGVITRIS